MVAQKKMKLQIVICELNPIHFGHMRVIGRAGAESGVVAAIMSGNFVERAEPAMFDKYKRARAAVQAGCDLVFELPYPWSAAGVERFAQGGMMIASAVAPDSSGKVVFGSESGDIEYIRRLSRVKASDGFADMVCRVEKEFRKTGSAAVFDEALRRYGIDVMPEANDKLAAEYIRFGELYGIGDFQAVRRDATLKSATELRSHDFSDEIVKSSVPETAYRYLTRAQRCNMSRFEEILYSHARLYLRSSQGKKLSEPLSVLRLYARDVGCADEFVRSIATKKYTAARMRRELLYSLTGVCEESFENTPEGVLLLAANERGLKYLSENRRHFKIPVITKPADMTGKAWELTAFADELYAYLYGLTADYYMKQRPEILLESDKG